MEIIDVLNIDIIDYIVKNIDFRDFILLLNSIINVKKIENDNIWKQLCINFKNEFYWELCSMRTESFGIIKCDKKLSWKNQLKDIYRYEKISNINSQTDICYCTLWILNEFNLKQIKIATEMINKVYKYYENEMIKCMKMLLEKKSDKFFSGLNPLLLYDRISMKEKKKIILNKVVSFIKNPIKVSDKYGLGSIHSIKLDFLTEIFDKNNVNTLIDSRLYHFKIDKNFEILYNIISMDFS